MFYLFGIFIAPRVQVVPPERQLLCPREIRRQRRHNSRPRGILSASVLECGAPDIFLPRAWSALQRRLASLLKPARRKRSTAQLQIQSLRRRRVAQVIVVPGRLSACRTLDAAASQASSYARVPQALAFLLSASHISVMSRGKACYLVFRVLCAVVFRSRICFSSLSLSSSQELLDAVPCSRRHGRLARLFSGPVRPSSAGKVRPRSLGLRLGTSSVCVPIRDMRGRFRTSFRVKIGDHSGAPPEFDPARTFPRIRRCPAAVPRLSSTGALHRPETPPRRPHYRVSRARAVFIDAVIARLRPRSCASCCAWGAEATRRAKPRGDSDEPPVQRTQG